MVVEGIQQLLCGDVRCPRLDIKPADGRFRHCIVYRNRGDVRRLGLGVERGVEDSLHSTKIFLGLRWSILEEESGWWSKSLDWVKQSLFLSDGTPNFEPLPQGLHLTPQHSFDPL